MMQNNPREPVMVFRLPKIACEVPPTTTVRELESQGDVTTPRMAQWVFETAPSEKRYTLSEARNRARVLSVHTGVVLEEHKDIIIGGVGTGVTPMVTSAQWRSIQSGIFRERYGNTSFLMEWASGMSSTIDFQWALDNFTIEERFHSIPPGETETPAELRQRTEMVIKYRNAIADLRKLWTGAYINAFYNAIFYVERTSGFVQSQWGRKRDFYRIKKESPPASRIDPSLLTSRTMCEDARVPHICDLQYDDQLAVWKEKITADVLSSVLQESSGVVDVRNLLGLENRATQAGDEVPAASVRISCRAMWDDRLARTVEILDRMHIRPQLRAYVQEGLTPDIYSRDGLGVSPAKDKTQAIKDLYQDMGIDNEERYGSWQDVPILTANNKGVKRKLPTFEKDGLRNHGSSNFVIMDN